LIETYTTKLGETGEMKIKKIDYLERKFHLYLQIGERIKGEKALEDLLLIDPRNI